MHGCLRTNASATGAPCGRVNSEHEDARDICGEQLGHGEVCILRCADGFHFEGQPQECLRGVLIDSRSGRCVAGKSRPSVNWGQLPVLDT